MKLRPLFMVQRGWILGLAIWLVQLSTVSVFGQGNSKDLCAVGSTTDGAWLLHQDIFSTIAPTAFSYASYATPANIKLSSTSFSISLWLMMNTVGTTQTIFSSGTLSGSGQTFLWQWSSADQHAISFSNMAAGTILNSGTVTSDLRQWHFWTLTFNTAGSPSRMLYRDGVLAASDSPASQFITAATLYLGYNGLAGTSSNYINAYMDEFRVRAFCLLCYANR